MTYDESIDWLFGTQLFGMKLGLNNTRTLLLACGSPEKKISAIHVAGTNGKGSTCAFAERLLRSLGLRTGLFTSPHLVSFRERIQVNGEMVSEDEIAAGLTNLRKIAESLPTHPTFFELTFALAMQIFQDREIDIAVVETGMGGRLDATNVLSPLVSVLTPISLDHCQWLGETIAAIAAEKAGIIKKNVPVVSAVQSDAAAMVIQERARDQAADLLWIYDAWSGTTSLPGPHQCQNAALARAAVIAAGFAPTLADCQNAFAETRWPARFDIRSFANGQWIIDGAHNPAAANVLKVAWRENFGDRKAPVIFGAVQTKDLAGVLREIAEIAEKFAFVPVSSARAVPAATLRDILRTIAPAIPATVFPNLTEAVQALDPEKLVLVTGSLFLSGEMIARVEAVDFESSLQ